LKPPSRTIAGAVEPGSVEGGHRFCAFGERARENEEKGTVIAVALASKAQAASNYNSYPSGVFNFLRDTWEAMQNAAVLQTKSLIGSANVLELSEHIRSTSFNEILEPGLQEIYQRSKDETSEWLEDWLSRRPYQYQVGPTTAGNIGLARQSFVAIQRDAQRIVDRIVEQQSETTLSIDHTVIMRNVKSSFDEVHLRQKIRNDGNAPIVGTQVEAGYLYLNAGRDFGVIVNDEEGRDIPSVVLPLPNDGTGQRYLVMFGEPLAPGRAYHIAKIEVISGFMDDLRNNGEDTLAVYALNGKQWEHASITLHVPEQFPLLVIQDDTQPRRFAPSTSRDETIRGDRIIPGLHGYRRVSEDGVSVTGLAVRFTTR
jgi:hypothetical protein